MALIRVGDIITGKLDHEDGSILYHAMSEYLKKNEQVTIDFSRVDVISSSFTNTSFRIIAREYEYNVIKSLVKIVNSNSTINRLIKDCFETALQIDTSPINRDNNLYT